MKKNVDKKERATKNIEYESVILAKYFQYFVFTFSVCSLFT